MPKEYLHIFPSFGINHNLTASYESSGFYEVSWDDPGHNNNFQYHLKDKRWPLENTFMFVYSTLKKLSLKELLKIRLFGLERWLSC